MHTAIKEYTQAVEESIEACRAEIVAKDRSKKAHYRLMRAKEALRATEADLLQDLERINS